jgi:hypothetical protein
MQHTLIVCGIDARYHLAHDCHRALNVESALTP